MAEAREKWSVGSGEGAPSQPCQAHEGFTPYAASPWLDTGCSVPFYVPQGAESGGAESSE